MPINHEYRVDIKVRNNLFIEKIEGAGYKTIGEFCRLHKLNTTRIGEIISMKVSPLMANGKFQIQVQKAANILACFPEDLFSEDQMTMALKNNKYSIKVKEAEIKFMLDQTKPAALLDDMVLENQKNNLLKKALDSLPIREKKILSLRFGLEDGIEHTLDEIGREFGVSATRIRDVESRALRRLRHPIRSAELQELI